MKAFENDLRRGWLRPEFSRRQFLYQSLTGVGGIALMELLGRDLPAAGPADESPLAPKPPHHPAKARSCIFLTMLGGVGQMDTFDPKPALNKFHDTPMDWSKEKKTDQPGLFAKPRHINGSPFRFAKYGQCGMDVSELFPDLAGCVDDMAFVRSVQADNGNHPAAVFQMNTGFVTPGSPSLGAWLTFGLGAENQNLPAYVALPDFRSIPFSGAQRAAMISNQVGFRARAVGQRLSSGGLPGHGAPLEGRGHTRPAATRGSEPSSPAVRAGIAAQLEPGIPERPLY